MNEDEKVNIHAALEMFTSGQLLFLGSKQRIMRRQLMANRYFEKNTA